MRILSQDGMIDVNYDLGNLSIASGRYEDVERAGIYFHSCSCPNATRLAEYTSFEKARKAMDMLREAYCGNLYIYIDDFVLRARNYDSRPELLKILNEIVGKVKYFRFPSDDETEV